MPTLTPVVESTETLAPVTEGVETLAPVSEGTETLTPLDDLVHEPDVVFPGLLPSTTLYPDGPLTCGSTPCDPELLCGYIDNPVYPDDNEVIPGVEGLTLAVVSEGGETLTLLAED